MKHVLNQINTSILLVTRDVNAIKCAFATRFNKLIYIFEIIVYTNLAFRYSRLSRVYFYNQYFIHTNSAWYFCALSKRSHWLFASKT